LFQYTAKYAFVYEDAKKQENNKKKKGKYMFFVSYIGKKEYYLNGHVQLDGPTHSNGKRNKKIRDPNTSKPLRYLFLFLHEERNEAKKVYKNNNLQ